MKAGDTNKKRNVCESEVMGMIGEVSIVAITGIIFSAVIAIGLPVVLLILVKVKLHARVAGAGIGALTFVLFALVLEQILHGGTHTLVYHLDRGGKDQIASCSHGIIHGILHLVVRVDLFDGEGLQFSAECLL